jgi:hypothetical protein
MKMRSAMSVPDDTAIPPPPKGQDSSAGGITKGSTFHKLRKLDIARKDAFLADASGADGFSVSVLSCFFQRDLNRRKRQQQ